MSASRVFFASAGIDPKIQGQVVEIFDAVVADKEFQAKAAASKIALLPMNGAEYTKYLQNLYADTKAVYDEAPW